MKNLLDKKFGRYHITSQLGRGGMAVVYKAFDMRLAREVALKVIRTDAVPPEQYNQLMRRFDREAKAQAHFSHVNIVPVYDYGQINGSPYIVMEFIQGGTLKEKLGRPIPYRQALRWVEPIAEALSYAHQMGVVHRDIKPGNILFRPDGRPVLTDFGIAKILETEDTSLTSTGIGMGTPGYMAPEQWHGRSGEASDQYALGVVLYELLTGRKPYNADTPVAIALKQMNEPLPVLRQMVLGIPVSVEGVLFKALSINPGDRYENMGAFHHSLVSLINHPESGDLTAQTTFTKHGVTQHPPQIERGGKAMGADWPHNPPITNVPQNAGQNDPQKRQMIPGWIFGAGLGALLLVLLVVLTLSAISRDNKPDLGAQLQTAAQAGLAEENKVLSVEITPAEGLIEESAFVAQEPNEKMEDPELIPTITKPNVSEPTNTLRPTATSSKYITPTPRIYTSLQGCAKSQLRVGDSAFISYDGGKNHLRSAPDTAPADNIIGDIFPGEVVIIVGGPVCNYGWPLWEVETTRQERGWTPETNGKEFWLLPLATRNICEGALPTRLIAGHKAKVNEEPPDANLLRPSPSRFEEKIGRIPPGKWMLVLEGPVCGEGTHWWKVEDLATGTVGWTMEGSPDLYYLSPKP
jgi:serine/threonine protein kinase